MTWLCVWGWLKVRHIVVLALYFWFCYRNDILIYAITLEIALYLGYTKGLYDKWFTKNVFNGFWQWVGLYMPPLLMIKGQAAWLNEYLGPLASSMLLLLSVHVQVR